MATFNNIQSESYIAGASLVTKQYTFVSINASGKIVGPTLGQACAGVLTTSPALDQVGAVAWIGSPMVYAGATVAIGAVISADATGRAITATTGHIALGIAREAAVVGQLMKVDFFRGGNVV